MEHTKLSLAVAVYVFIYAAVMLDSQRRVDEVGEKAKTQRKWFSSLTLIISFAFAAYCGYELYKESDHTYIPF